MSNTKTCGSCHGSGHDKAGRPVIRMDQRQTPEGPRRFHVTVKQGSGCITCGGVGRTPTNS